MERRIRVLSYNIHKGFSSGNRRFVLGRIKEAIQATEADLVFLQEVQGEHSYYRQSIRNWPDSPQFEYLADQIWPHFAYGKNCVYEGGHHGNAILSKHPFKFWENIDVSTNRLEKRGLLHGVIEIPGWSKPLHAICVHLGLLENERRSQIRAICERVGRLVPPDDYLILSGDFNDWRLRATSALCRSLRLRETFLELQGSHARTFPSWMPALRLDRIYYRGFTPEAARSLHGRPWNKLSDHVPLYAELAYR